MESSGISNGNWATPSFDETPPVPMTWGQFDATVPMDPFGNLLDMPMDFDWVSYSYHISPVHGQY